MKHATVAYSYSETALSRPVAAAALAIPDRAALIFSRAVKTVGLRREIANPPSLQRPRSLIRWPTLHLKVLA